MPEIITEAYAWENQLVIAEGKTKIIARQEGRPDYCRIISKSDITAGDGAKHDIIDGKAAMANRTACNVFRLIKACGIPVAFTEQLSSVGFGAPLCTMLPYEVVVRREAYGSYIDRNPHLAKGHIFPKLLVEFFLKTKDKEWKNPNGAPPSPLLKDDPFIRFDYPNNCMDLFYPGHSAEERKSAAKGALVGQLPFLTLHLDQVFTRTDERELIGKMADIARRTFLVLEKAWQIQGRKLVDFKVEFGLDSKGNLLLADVIDNDSWRVVDGDGGHIDKQVYREGGDLDEVAAKYALVTELTSRFTLPSQQLIIWRGSEKDDADVLIGTVNSLLNREEFLPVPVVTCSVHKQPALAYATLQRTLSKVPDSVIIAYIGRSNGAGPTLSANTTVPVITVPAGYRDFREDVWSSLRTPSNVPVMTVLEPANAALAALQILAMRNPCLYSILRFDQESRLTDI